MKFLHTGDVHLGAVPEGGTGLEMLRGREIWDAFRDIIERCERDRIDLLLIPGDLFHGQPLLKEVKEVDYLFRRLTHTRVVMCAGNHDFLHPKSHYYDVMFPEHVTFLMDSRADSVYLPELNVEVFGLSYETKQIPEPRYHAIRPTHPERINILLAHGNVLCNDKSIPIQKDIVGAVVVRKPSELTAESVAVLGGFIHLADGLSSIFAVFKHNCPCSCGVHHF